jgi:hypothetical protein
MRLRNGGLVAALILGGLAGVMPGANAGAAEAPGYERVRVEPARISFVLPDDWEIGENMTREKAERLAAHDPDLDAEMLLKLPFSAAWFDVGSDYPDSTVDVVVNGKAKDYQSPAALRKLMSRGGAPDDLTIARTTVTGTPALVARYTLQAGRDDNMPMHFETYYFVGPKGPMYLNFYRDAQDDPDFDAITETILDSVRMDST